MANKRIKDLATTKYTGYAALDDANGTGKFPIDNLIGSIAEIYYPQAIDGHAATNAVAGNLYMYQGKCWRCKENTSGTWDSSKFENVNLADLGLKGCGRLKAGFYSNDLNNLTKNTIFAITDNTDGEAFANRPNTEKQFTVITMSPCLTGGDSLCKIQIVYTSGGRHFIRSYWGSTWTDWIAINNIMKTYVVNSTPSSPYNDLDTYPLNSIVLCTQSGVSNSPVAYGFTAVTIGADATATTQIVFAQNKADVYVRIKWSTWGNWIKMTEKEISLVVNPTTSSSPYNNLDSYPMNSIVLVSSGENNVSNKPSNDSFTCTTLGANSAAMTQIVSTVKRVTWVRSKWGTTWGDWVKIEKPPYYNDVFSAFTNIICVGDSLTYSQVYTSENGNRQAYKPWPSVIGQMSGASVSNMGYSGDDGIASWNRWKDSFESKTNALAIIYLGTNHGFTDTLDTDAPSGQPYTSWADTNTGCYAKIIAKLQDLGYKVLLVKPWVVSSPGVLSDTQKVVDDAGTRFGCSVVGPISNSNAEFHYWPDHQGTNNTHMNDLGYSWFAHELAQKVASLGDTLKFIIPA